MNPFSITGLLTLEVMHSLFHQESLTDGRAMFASEKITELLEVVLILVEGDSSVGLRCHGSFRFATMLFKLQ